MLRLAPAPGPRPLVVEAEEVRVLAVRVGVERQYSTSPRRQKICSGRCRGGSRRRASRRARRGSHDRLGRDRGVVEVAVAAEHRARRVVAGRPTQPVGDPGPAEHEVNAGQRDVDRCPRRGVRPLDDRGGRVERPVAQRPAMCCGSRRTASDMPSVMSALSMVSGTRNPCGMPAATVSAQASRRKANEAEDRGRR